jgi:hypothetical protein
MLYWGSFRSCVAQGSRAPQALLSPPSGPPSNNSFSQRVWPKSPPELLLDPTITDAGAPPKDHVMDGKFAELLQHLQMLLASYDNLDHSGQLNPVDAFFAFRLLLGRNPDLTCEFPRILNDTRTFRAFLTELLNSDEFSHRRGFVPPNRVFMAHLDSFRLWFNTNDPEMGMVMSTGQYEPHTVELIKKNS